jgi:hypothetical protein
MRRVFALRTAVRLLEVASPSTAPASCRRGERGDGEGWWTTAESGGRRDSGVPACGGVRGTVLVSPLVQTTAVSPLGESEHVTDERPKSENEAETESV